MTNYHFHFQQQKEGHREDVRPPSAPLVPLVSPYITTLHEESSFHGFQHRVRPAQGPHIATLAARPSRPHHRRQSFRSRSTSTCRSRSRPRRKTRRSRSSSPRSHRRSAALPKDPGFSSYTLQPRRCHLFRVPFILRILSILQQPFLHHPALLLRLRL